jgi:hypothetical protein
MVPPGRSQPATIGVFPSSLIFRRVSPGVVRALCVGRGGWLPSAGNPSPPPPGAPAVGASGGACLERLAGWVWAGPSGFFLGQIFKFVPRRRRGTGFQPVRENKRLSVFGVGAVWSVCRVGSGLCVRISSRANFQICPATSPWDGFPTCPRKQTALGVWSGAYSERLPGWVWAVCPSLFPDKFSNLSHDVAVGRVSNLSPLGVGQTTDMAGNP